jgi:geranylgeranyl pyrophosphate synthase
MLNQKTNTLYHEPTRLIPDWRRPVQDEMSMVEDRLVETPHGQHAMLTSTIEGLFNAGGKRVRPALSLLTAKNFDANLDHAVSLAAAVEMLHTATLVHDDLIDGAMLRRGAPTLNSFWSSDVAVLAGDYMFARAAKTLEIILNGEITQKFSKWQIDRDEYEERIYAKTAALFILSCHSAALLGNADKETVGAMIQYGRSIGMAFQIVDDVLDYTGEAEKVGKPIGGDLHQGLFTLPAILFAQANPQDEDLNKILTVKQAEPTLVQRLISKVQNSGTIEASLEIARTRLQDGKNALEYLPPSIYKDSLLTLADQVVNREA